MFYRYILNTGHVSTNFCNMASLKQIIIFYFVAVSGLLNERCGLFCLSRRLAARDVVLTSYHLVQMEDAENPNNDSTDSVRIM